MVDYAQWGHGGATYPLTASTSNSLLRDADPALFFALDFWGWAIGHALNARVAAMVATMTRPPLASALAESVPYDIADYLTTKQFKFPLLAVWRDDDKMRDLTAARRTNACNVSLAYVLPALDAAQAEQLLPLRRAVVATIDKLTRQGWHPSYTPPGDALGGVVWGEDNANIQAVDIVAAEYGYLPALDKTDVKFPAVLIQAVIHERDEVVAGALEAFAGADVNIDVRDEATSTTVSNVVQAKTDVG